MAPEIEGDGFVPPASPPMTFFQTTCVDPAPFRNMSCWPLPVRVMGRVTSPSRIVVSVIALPNAPSRAGRTFAFSRCIGFQLNPDPAPVNGAAIDAPRAPPRLGGGVIPCGWSGLGHAELSNLRIRHRAWVWSARKASPPWGQRWLADQTSSPSASRTPLGSFARNRMKRRITGSGRWSTRRSAARRRARWIKPGASLVRGVSMRGGGAASRLSSSVRKASGSGFFGVWFGKLQQRPRKTLRDGSGAARP